VIGMLEKQRDGIVGVRDGVPARARRSRPNVHVAAAASPRIAFGRSTRGEKYSSCDSKLITSCSFSSCSICRTMVNSASLK